MKAAIYNGKKNIKMTTLMTPHAGVQDVVIQNIYAGICGSDVAVYNYGTNTGHKVGKSHEFGHETVSRIVEVGADVTDFKVGERVYPYPLFARNDTSRAGSMGGFSEYILIPEAKLNHSLYKVPESISDKTAAMIEPFTVGTRAAKQTRINAGENAIVYGAGTIGLAVAVALKYLGANQVVVVDKSDFRLAIAAKLGFAIINNRVQEVQTTAESILGKSTGLNGDCPAATVYVDAVGSNAILNDFMLFGEIGSRFVTVGINNQRPDFSFLELIYGSKSVGGSGGYRPEDVMTVFDIMSSHKFDLEQLITAEVGWSDLEEGIIKATDVNTALKVLVNYHVDSEK